MNRRLTKPLLTAMLDALNVALAGDFDGGDFDSLDRDLFERARDWVVDELERRAERSKR